MDNESNTSSGHAVDSVSAGYQWPWISVRDRMPKMVKHHEESIVNGVRCSAFSESERCMILLNGRTVTDSKYVYWADSDNHHWSMISSEVTHWMPYPDSSGAILSDNASSDARR